eukprot:4424945-Pyramimonas_sp.AAC.1
MAQDSLQEASRTLANNYGWAGGGTRSVNNLMCAPVDVVQNSLQSSAPPKKDFANSSGLSL